MADVTKRINVKYVLDDSGYNSKIAGLNAQNRNLLSSVKLAREGIKGFGADSKKLKQVQEGLSKQIEIHAKKIDIYKQQIEKTDKKLRDNIKTRDELKNKLSEANKKYDEAVKIYGKESEEAKKAKEEVDKLSKEHEKASKNVETNAKQIQNYETNMNKAKTQMTKTKAELEKVNKELAKSDNKWLNSSKRLKETADKLKGIGSKVEGIGDSILKLTTPLATAGIASLKFTTDFHDGVAKVNTIADTTKKPLSELKKEMLELSNKTGVAAKGITESTYQAISASVDTAKAVDFVGISTKASVAGFTDAATAVDGLSTVLNSYGLEADKANKIANQMLITQNEGKTSFGELAESMGKVTPIAANLGIKTDELFSSLATTTAQGLNTAESVTGLKAAMSNLIKPSKDCSDLTAQLGIDFSVSALKSKGWIGLLKDVKKGLENSVPEFKRLQDNLAKNVYRMLELEKAGKKNSKEYKTLKKESNLLSKQFELMAQASDSPVSGMAKIFGSVQGLNTVLMLTSDQGIKKYNKAMESMKTNTHALDDAYEKMTSTTGFKFKKSLNQMKNVAIKFGDSLAPMMDRVSMGIQKLAEKLNGMSKEQMDSIVKWGKMTIGLGAFLKIGGKGIVGVSKGVEGLSKLHKILGKVNAGAGVASKAVGVASGSVKGFGIASKLATILTSKWTFAIAAVGFCAYEFNKHMSKEVVPSVDLFADHVEKSIKTVGKGNRKYRRFTETTIKISEATKKVVGSYMEMDKGVKEHLSNLYISHTIITDNIKNETISKFSELNKKILEGQEKKNAEQLQTMQQFFNKSNTLMWQEEEGILENIKRHNEEKKQEQIKQVDKIKEILEKAKNDKRDLTNSELSEIHEIQEKMKTNAIKSLSETETESKIILERAKEYDKRITTEQAAQHIQKLNEQRDKAIKNANEEHEKRLREIIKLRDESKVISADQAEKLIKDSEKQRDKTIENAETTRRKSVQTIMSMNSDLKNNVDETTGKILTKWDKLKNWWNKWWPSKKNFNAEVHVKSPGAIRRSGWGNIQRNWKGNRSFEGGLTYLHDQPGKSKKWELYDLPNKTRIYNHDASEELVIKTAENVANKVANSLLKSFNSNTNTNTKGTFIIQLDKKVIGKAVAPLVGKQLISTTLG